MCDLYRSVSYVLVMSSVSFLLLAALYSIVDVDHYWNGSPLTYLGKARCFCYTLRYTAAAPVCYIDPSKLLHMALRCRW